MDNRDSDTISRKQTLEHFKKRLYESALNNDGIASKIFEEIADNRVQIWVDELPPSPTVTADPDTISRPKGHWVDIGWTHNKTPTELCSVCSMWSLGRDENFCPNCGANMRMKLPPSPSRPQWIPCSNRLPDEEVLCCDTRGEMIIGYPYQDEESSTGYGAVLDDVVMIDCIAWMPLPEPYQSK